MITPSRVDLIRRCLVALAAMDGQPMQQDLLVDAMMLRFSPRPTRGDVDAAIRDAEASGYIAGTTVDLEGVVWTLTSKGTLKAQSLRS